ncbi:MAG: HAD-IA family hydrolase [Candidatus Marinimicrobia bacterium]|nr:HAD-IA family hydrolase [Candidatus Neomarinimicrobiota bacterium]
MLNPNGILFDLDGTLVDTSRDISANLNRAFEALGYPRLTHEKILSHVGYGAHFLVQQCLQTHRPDVKVDDQLVTEIWEKFRDFYHIHIIDDAQPYPGVIEFLKREQRRPMGVISNKPQDMVRAVLKGLDLLQYFKFSWGRDTFPVSKPDPEIIRYGVHELGFDDPGQVCMVGDNQVDTIAAKGAGAVSVAVTYGFTPSARLEQEEPDYLLNSFPEFVEALRS